MKSWKERLHEFLERNVRPQPAELDVEGFRSAVKIFAAEISRIGFSASVDDRTDSIGLRITGANANPPFELLAHFQPEPKLSVFSTEVVISNYRLAGLRGASEEEILQFLAMTLAAAKPLRG